MPCVSTGTLAELVCNLGSSITFGDPFLSALILLIVVATFSFYFRIPGELSLSFGIALTLGIWYINNNGLFLAVFILGTILIAFLILRLVLKMRSSSKDV